MCTNNSDHNSIFYSYSIGNHNDEQHCIKHGQLVGINLGKQHGRLNSEFHWLVDRVEYADYNGRYDSYYERGHNGDFFGKLDRNNFGGNFSKQHSVNNRYNVAINFASKHSNRNGIFVGEHNSDHIVDLDRNIFSVKYCGIYCKQH